MLTPEQNLYFWVCATVTAVCVLGLLWAERSNSQGGKWLFKPIAAAGFIAAAIVLNAQDHAYGLWVVVALVLSMVGDILLIPARVGPAFAAGLGAFLLGHVAFCVAFVVRGIDWTWTLVATAVFSVVGIIIYRWLKDDVPERLRVPVMAYVAVITAMVALSVGTTLYQGSQLIPVAAFMFWLSDISVARGRFKEAGFSNRAWGIPLYFGAQVVFAYATLT